MDIGNNCVYCNKDTSFGSGKFVNRIPADADCEMEDSEGNIIFQDGQYRDGYACTECMVIECDRCDEMVSLHEDITAQDVFGIEADTFKDRAYRVHYDCLTKEEKDLLEEQN